MPLNHKRSNEPYPLFIIPLNAIFLQSPLSPPPFWQVSLLPLLPFPSILQVLYSKWSHVQAIFFHGEIIIALWSIRAVEWYVAGFVYLEKTCLSFTPFSFWNSLSCPSILCSPQYSFQWFGFENNLVTWPFTPVNGGNYNMKREQYLIKQLLIRLSQKLIGWVKNAFCEVIP